MTHEDILNNMIKMSTVGDYVSIAFANGWSRIRIVEEFSSYYQATTGRNAWSTIANLVDKFISDYGMENVEQKRVVGQIKYEGFVYDSVADASKITGSTVAKIRYAIEKGRAVYV